MEVLKQDRNAPVPVEKQVAILYATINGFLKDIEVSQVAEYEKSLYEYLDSDAAAAGVMQTIRTTGAWDKDIEAALKAALTAFTAQFSASH